MTTFYDWSGGMESSAMLWLERQRILDTKAIVRWADTGKHFPEMYASKAQIEALLQVPIVTVPRRITFDEFLFERGGIIRKGTNDCSRRMKRSNLSRHMKTFPRPYEINLGFNAGEVVRAESFSERNDREWCKWRYPLIELGVEREETWEVCRKAGFTVLVGMYDKMGRFDCYMCGNQSPKQAALVVRHYPELAAEWIAMEDKKGHSFMPIPLRTVAESQTCDLPGVGSGCSCFGGTEDVHEDEDRDV